MVALGEVKVNRPITETCLCLSAGPHQSAVMKFSLIAAVVLLALAQGTTLTPLLYTTLLSI